MQRSRESRLSLLAILVPFLLIIIVPNLLRFDARAKQTEAKQNLCEIYTAYQNYHSQYHTYPTSPSIKVGNNIYNCLNIAEWEPRRQLRYTYICNGKPAYWPGWDNNMAPMNCGYSSSARADKNSFTITACGNIDWDATQDEWTIDDAGHLRNVIDDVRDTSISQKKWWQRR
jgi:hypothetical protein